jgi:hypothetical protein
MFLSLLCIPFFVRAGTIRAAGAELTLSAAMAPYHAQVILSAAMNKLFITPTTLTNLPSCRNVMETQTPTSRQRANARKPQRAEHETGFSVRVASEK